MAKNVITEDVVNFLRSATEEQLREFDLIKLGWIKSRADMMKVVNALTEREHSYGSCVYAMSISTHAVFMYVSHILGATGFQASFADLDFMRRSRMLKHPFRIVDYGNLLYPQYLDEEHFPSLDTLLKQNREWLSIEAEKLLKEERGCVEVREHWEKLRRKELGNR